VTVGYSEIGLEVHNRTATPLYLLPAAGDVESPPAQLSVVSPDNMVPKGKVVAGEWFVWAGGRWASTNAPDAAQNVTVPRLEDRNRITPVRPGSVSGSTPASCRISLSSAEIGGSSSTMVTFGLCARYY
jgi:hypothetical protein